MSRFLDIAVALGLTSMTALLLVWTAAEAGLQETAALQSTAVPVAAQVVTTQ